MDRVNNVSICGKYKQIFCNQINMQNIHDKRHYRSFFSRQNHQLYRTAVHTLLHDALTIADVHQLPFRRLLCEIVGFHSELVLNLLAGDDTLVFFRSIRNLHGKVSKFLCEQGVAVAYTPFMNYLKKTVYLFLWPIYQTTSIEVLGHVMNAEMVEMQPRPEGIDAFVRKWQQAFVQMETFINNHDLYIEE